MSSWALVAFPGAEGFGANAVGGRGGDVYHVTTLANDPTHIIRGSLFYGLYSKSVPAGGRTIVFDVGGTLDLSAGTSQSLDIKDIHNVTIAGQTAPSPITIIGNTVNITGNSTTTPTHDLIVQYLTCRKGTGDGDDALHVQGTGDTHDVIIDHVSGSWSEDEVISVTQTARNVTVQNSIMSEALTSGHQFGSLIRPTVDSQVSYLHNFYSNQASRNPRPGTYNGKTLSFEFQNNVVYNWSDRAGYIAGADTDVQHLNMNYQGNYLVAGPSTIDNSSAPVRRETAFYKENTTGGPLDVHIFQRDDKIDSNTNSVRDGTDTGWGMFQQLTNGAPSALPDADKSAIFGTFPQANSYDQADVAYGKVISSVGAFPYARSTTDQRLISDVLNYTGTAPLTTPNSSEWNALVAGASPANWTSRAANFDEEDNGNYTSTSWEGTQTNPQPRPKGDGMPSWWETLRGYSTTVDDHNVVTSDGYTRLEHYLQYLTEIANWNSTNADGSWSDNLNWRGTLPNHIDATANFVAGNSATRTVNLDTSVTLSHLNFTSGNSYILNGSSTLNMQAIDGSAEINVSAGSHAIWAPVALSNPLIFTAAAGSGLTFTNLQPSTVTITKNGAGGLAVNNVRASGLAINAGTVAVLANGTNTGTSKVSSLGITTAAGAKLDLSNNKLIVAGGTLGSFNGSSYNGITGLIATGRHGGDWQGAGIYTSQANAANPTALTTLAVKSITSAGTFGGLPVSSGDVVVMYTYAGDATLDGKINGDDYFAIDSHINAPGAFGYANGDFDYSGRINGDDYFLIDSNINRQSLGVFSASVMAVPEPASFALIALTAAVSIRRRRSRPI